jgi:hypothetical protein
MDFDDAQLKAVMAALNVVSGEEPSEDDEEEMEMEMDEEEKDEKEAAKKAAVDVTARLDRLESSLGRVVKAMGHFFGMDEDEDEGMSDKELMAYLMAEDMDGDGVDQNKADYAYTDDKKSMDESDEHMAMKHMSEDDDEEAMLRAMLEEMDAEMKMASQHVEEVTDPLAKGESVQSGEGGNVKPDAEPKTPQVSQADGSEKHASDEDANPADNDIEITAGMDPMGLMDKDASADDELLALYADLDLPKTAGEEEDDEEEEMEMDEEEEMDEKEPAKKASDAPKPQPKKASSGAQQLGNVSGMPKAAHDEIAELSKLWEVSPNVNKTFGLPE